MHEIQNITFPYFKLLVCKDKDPSENTFCTSALIKSPSCRYFLIICSSSADRLLYNNHNLSHLIQFKSVIRTNSPPGKLTDDNNKIESNLEFVSTFHRFCCTSVILPITTSPVSPLYRHFSGRIDINLFISSLTPATDAFKSPFSS